MSEPQIQFIEVAFTVAGKHPDQSFELKPDFMKVAVHCDMSALRLILVSFDKNVLFV